VHAVSVGEVTAAAPIVASLKQIRPEVEIFFPPVRRQVRKWRTAGKRRFRLYLLSPGYSLCCPQNDSSGQTGCFCDGRNRTLPNFLTTCHEYDIKALMVNGRISPRSYGKYRLTKFFWQNSLRTLSTAE